MKTKIIIGLIAILLLSSAAVALPDEQCTKLAENKDNLVQNIVPELTSTGTKWKNPCTGTYMLTDVYRDDNSGFGRRVFENGDVFGSIGVTKYTTKYVLCHDGRAEVRITTFQWIKGIAYGLWYNNPHMSWQTGYTIEQCSTL
jgi:hypothetical protein